MANAKIKLVIEKDDMSITHICKIGNHCHFPKLYERRTKHNEFVLVLHLNNNILVSTL